MQPDNNSSTQIDNPLAVMQPGEKVLLEMKRTPIGLVPVYASGIIVIIVMAAIAVLIPQFVPDIDTQFRNLLLMLFGVVALITIIFVYISVTIYNANRWVITNDSITQISQHGLFHRHASQLSLANLEDVTTDQRGLLQSLFHYGTVIVETAGERSKFTFPYCPSPTQHAQQILKAHEDFIYNQPSAAEKGNKDLHAPHTMPRLE